MADQLLVWCPYSHPLSLEPGLSCRPAAEMHAQGNQGLGTASQPSPDIRVKHVAAIDYLRSRQLFRGSPDQIHRIRPLCQERAHQRRRRRPIAEPCVIQLGDIPDVPSPLRLDHKRSLAHQDRVDPRHLQCWRVAYIVRVWLESHAEDTHSAAGECPVHHLLRQAYRPGSTPAVDCIHFAKKRDRLSNPQFRWRGPRRLVCPWAGTRRRTRGQAAVIPIRSAGPLPVSRTADDITSADVTYLGHCVYE